MLTLLDKLNEKPGRVACNVELKYKGAQYLSCPRLLLLGSVGFLRELEAEAILKKQNASAFSQLAIAYQQVLNSIQRRKSSFHEIGQKRT